jgi:hypothetical protein
MTRGYQNNNPGNIRLISANDKPFLGEIRPTTDPGWRQFATIEYGFRGLMKNLQSYIDSGHNNIEKIISRWAPSSDGNNTASYINNVEARTGINRKQIIDRNDLDSLQRLAYAISWSENGFAPAWSQINAGAQLLSETPGSAGTPVPGSTGSNQSKRWLKIGAIVAGTGIAAYLISKLAP